MRLGHHNEGAKVEQEGKTRMFWKAVDFQVKTLLVRGALLSACPRKLGSNSAG